MNEKAFGAALEIKADSEDGNTVTAIISTGAVDRDGEIMDPKGADLADFRKNPVVLWAHNKGAPPIGKALWVKRTKDDIRAKVRFATTDFGKEVFQLFKEGVLNAFSIGFRAVKAITPTKEDIRRNPKWKGANLVFTDWKLLEFSAVPIPANPEALALAVSKGILSDELLKTFDFDAKEGDLTEEVENDRIEEGEDSENEDSPRPQDEIAVLGEASDDLVVVVSEPKAINVADEVKKALDRARGRVF